MSKFLYLFYENKATNCSFMLEKISFKIDRLNERIGRNISWLTIILVVLVCYDVITRYVFKSSSVAVQELQWHLFAIIFLMAAAYTLKYDEHVRVDVFYSKLSERSRAIIDLVGTIVFLLPFCLIIIYASRYFVFTSFQIGETSPDPGGLPARYLLKAILPISFFFVLLQGISLILRSIVKIKMLSRREN